MFKLITLFQGKFVLLSVLNTVDSEVLNSLPNADVEVMLTPRYSGG